MPLSYRFKDTAIADKVSRILLYQAKFSKKQALVKFSDSSVSVIWGGSPKTYYIHAEVTHFDMFEIKKTHFGIDHCTIVQVDPTILGRTLRGSTHDRNVQLHIIRPNKIQVVVEYLDSSARTITHTIPCDIKTKDDYELMLIEKIEQRLCCYNTRSYIDSITRFKHIIDSIVRLGTPRVYIQSKQTDSTNCLKICAKNEGSILDVFINDLMGGLAESDSMRDEFDDEEEEVDSRPKRDTAGVQIDTKKLALYLSGLLLTKEQLKEKKARVSIDIEHNKCLKITLDYEVSQGEKMYQSLLLLHSLNN
jgi:hypothetical protein